MLFRNFRRKNGQRCRLAAVAQQLPVALLGHPFRAAQMVLKRLSGANPVRGQDLNGGLRGRPHATEMYLQGKVGHGGQKSASSWNTDTGCGAIRLVSRDAARPRLHNPR